MEAIAAGLVFILALFFCVVLHEFGHALTARRYGVKTHDIILLPIGGVARLERVPDNPRQELWIALAGPAVNLGIAVVLSAWLEISGGWQPVEDLSVSGGSFVERLLVVNVFLAIFNLVPAFPMDGGRVLRALLGMRLDYVKATRIAASVGQALALGFGFLGLFSNPFLVFIALFVWIGAAQEASMVEVRSALGGVPLRQVMMTDYRALSPTETLNQAVELTLATSQKDFPVLSEDRLVGLLTQGELLRALNEGGHELPVSDAMLTAFETAELTEPTTTVLRRLQGRGGQTLPVLADGHLAGLVTMDNVGEFLSIQEALEK